MSLAPSPNGRDHRGRFSKGWKGGPGNPLGGQVARLRSALVEAVTEDDITAIAQKLVEMAKAGDVAAIREVLNRTLGKPTEADLLDRLEAIEAQLVEGGVG